MEENLEKVLERLSEFIHNTTHYIQPTYDAAILEVNQYISSFDWENLKEEWIALGKHGIQLTLAAADGVLLGIQQELPKLQEEASHWIQETIKKGEQLPWNSRTAWTVFLLTLTFLWIMSSPRNKNRRKEKKEGNTKVEDQMIFSLFDLAKASYVKANALEVMDIVDPNYSVSDDKMTLFLLKFPDDRAIRKQY
ncbi:uncharacterized protein LOC115925838 [Strongylocentrotus purpuratus]|uniref:Uncharacterized protein n=1 Tax=Strongylocentrotus purpuratus TaxID=7668 RepID=A0A7M7T0W0_STRPU|nr:uncharacterized protein LOC115925838 [Strongylocentrotus purpuratus]